jgi:hypothetical protein
MVATAQSSTFKVKGKLTDSISGTQVELVTVQLKSPAATTPEYVQLSDLDGAFIFDRVQRGSYDLIFTFVGYDTKKIPVTVNKDLDLGTIKLATTSQALKEATVTSQKAVITKTSEKTVFNVAQSPTHQTGTAEDALRNMPGVSVDRNGNISMIGKQGVKVLVDGKPSVLAESNLQAFLKSIPANTIESIELITNPSARYEAEGNAGIINIKLKKGKRDGLNGSASAGYGYTARFNGNLVLNYRKNKINFFTTYGLNYKYEEHEFIDKRNITVRDTLSHYNMYNPSSEKNLTNTLKAGLDYFIDDKNTLTYTFSGSHNISRWPSNSTSQNYMADYSLMNSYQSSTNDHGLNYSFTNDINYLKKYDTTEREMMVDLSHTYVNSHSDNTLNSTGFDAAGQPLSGQSLSRRMISDNAIHNVIFQLNYAEPLKRAGHKIETGLKNETTFNKNDYNVFDKTNGVEAQNTLLSNSFDYMENIAAFYMIYTGAHKEWFTYSGGIRAEHTFIKSNKSNVSRNYLSLFPSATLSASFKHDQNLSLSYSRRVQRPEFRQINNAVTYFDQYSTWEGNPYIVPSFSNILSLSYTIQIKKAMISISSDNTFRTNAFSESSHVDSLRITRGTVINGGDDRVIGGSVYVKVPITKWWEVQMNHYIAWQRYDYRKDVNTGPVTGVYYNIWASMDFKFWKNTVFNINGWFNTGDVFPQGSSKAVGVINASIKKDFLKDRLSVSILAQNLLNTMKFQWYVNNTNLHTNGSWQNFNRTVMVTLTYRFGKDANPVKRRDLEENNRLGGGGGKR